MKHVDIELWLESFWLWSLESSFKKLKMIRSLCRKDPKLQVCHKECNKRAESAGTCRLPIGPTNFDRKFRSTYRFRSNRPEEPIGQPTFQTSLPGDARIFSERCFWQYLTLTQNIPYLLHSRVVTTATTWMCNMHLSTSCHDWTTETTQMVLLFKVERSWMGKSLQDCWPSQQVALVHILL